MRASKKILVVAIECVVLVLVLAYGQTFDSGTPELLKRYMGIGIVVTSVLLLITIVGLVCFSRKREQLANRE